jgi:hypothetical protein
LVPTSLPQPYDPSSDLKALVGFAYRIAAGAGQMVSDKDDLIDLVQAMLASSLIPNCADRICAARAKIGLPRLPVTTDHKALSPAQRRALRARLAKMWCLRHLTHDQDE